ncbi:MAG TPA: IgGFc-binding protein [Sandaracinaceae bacterium LLY-WYZ-13_1]|nr:IgGFc-binding protein [Sandaracinaceae bacterium LLY-WYZ-13_1]
MSSTWRSAGLAAVVISMALSTSLVWGGCTAGGDSPRDGSVGGGDGSSEGCEAGELYCAPGEVVQTCRGGERVDQETCTGDTVCAEGLGCVACRPDYYRCDGQNLYRCRADGSGWDIEMTCTADEVCTAGGRVGMCADACAEAVARRSNIGCEYWAVDLDNEYAEGIAMNDAYSQQFAVAIANPSEVTATVRVFVNDASGGGVPVEREVFSGTVAPRDVLEIPLDQREVDGPPGSHVDTRGSWFSSHAYKITSNYPVVAYQFNPIVQDFSNDASLLIPSSGLDNHYRVLGWPTANPIEPFGDIAGIPDHSFVTIVGVEEATTVRVTLGGPIVGDNFGVGIAQANAGDVVEWTLGPYDVLNLESRDIPGDLTGTVVESDEPVVVFSGGERGLAPISEDGVPAPPGGPPDNVCCTEHLEEQVFPTTAWGKDFVITRSPQRGRTWAEPDIYRVMADRESTTITTNLPAPNDSFTLGPGEWREFYAQQSFTMQASHPVSIEQILVSQAWVDDWRDGHGGDPSMILFPPYQQYRESYVFLTPSTFSADYVVISAPLGTRVLLDGGDINGDEFMSLCTYEMAGEVEGTVYQAVTCPVDDGAHTIDADMPVGIMVYGYYNVGSYGYAGGSDLERINPLI